MTHGYICECSSKRCRRRIYLRPSEYRVLARLGMVLTAECAWREQRRVVSQYNGYRIVVAQNSGGFHGR